MENKAEYVWRVLVYDAWGDLVRSKTKLFASKISAMNYANQMQSTAYKESIEFRGRINIVTRYFRTKIEKWFGN